MNAAGVKIEDEEGYTIGVPEAKLHDLEFLPHHHSHDQIAEFFTEAKVDGESYGELADYEADNREIVFGPLMRP